MSISLTRLQEVSAFVTAYQSIFQTLDAEKIAALYATPCFGLSAEGPTTFPTRADLLANFAAVTCQLRGAGLSSSSYELVGHTEIAPTILEIAVKWRLFRADGELIKDLHVIYVVHTRPTWLIAGVYGVA